MYVDTGCQFDQFLVLYALDEEMSYIGEDGKSYLNRTRDEVERDVRLEAQRLARGDDPSSRCSEARSSDPD